MEASENIPIYTEIGAAWADKYLESIYISCISKNLFQKRDGKLGKNEIFRVHRVLWLFPKLILL